MSHGNRVVKVYCNECGQSVDPFDHRRKHKPQPHPIIRVVSVVGFLLVACLLFFLVWLA